MGIVRVFLADGQAIIREGLKCVFAASPEFEVVGEAGDGPTAIPRVAELAPDVVIADIAGPDLTALVRPDRRVLVFTAHEDRGSVRAALEAGASGYLLKRATIAEVVQAVRVVADGGTHLDPAVAVNAADPEAVEMSEREMEVVRLIAHGYSNKEIAARLCLSVKTVETYKARSMEKLGVRTRVGLVRYALDRGWLTAL